MNVVQAPNADSPQLLCSCMLMIRLVNARPIP